ncbi:MAG: hypothetical protein A3C44_03060 [Gammaproteobacteria bacterium RIFCSPHIGHO2_02_FULL_39_13]|nr:MAG: hypothetical protein A3C44_03060 [Gammaproteobacteria bacterium RIFCSPHIGHO2_02_FULL_39_13]OGT50323.1 MAG: hypothetical protein A3E53_01050 [Gammaproteobacteria bacterium RIFCSPHIGHO2_12_FULL_39_24]
MAAHTKKQLESGKHHSKTDFAKIDALSDREIDYSDIPELNDTFWTKATVIDHLKKPISLRVDIDVLTWFKHQDGRYQKLMNYVLRQYMNAHRRHR